MGIEPTQSAWKAEILPLNYTRSSKLTLFARFDTKIVSKARLMGGFSSIPKNFEQWLSFFGNPFRLTAVCFFSFEIFIQLTTTKTIIPTRFGFVNTFFTIIF